MGADGVGEVAEERSVDECGVVAEEDDGAGAAVGGDVGCGGVVCGGEDPADVGEGAGVGDEFERGPISGGVGMSGSGDEDRFAGKGGSNGFKRCGNGVGRDGRKADEDLCDGVRRRSGRVVQRGVGDGGD